MPTESVVTVLIVAIFGNLVLMLLLLATLAVRRRNRLMLSGGMPFPATEMRRPDPLARTAQQGMAVTPAHLSAPAMSGPGMAAVAGATTQTPLETIPGDGDWLDQLTGLDGRLSWERAVREEGARLDRYGRPAAVVIAEVDGLAKLEERFGDEAGSRTVRAVGDALRRQARATDHVARIDDASFYVLLPETDEIAAINYVERVRAICDRWLESGAVSLRLSLGWASPAAGGDLGSALHIAQDRLNVERRQASTMVEAAST